jgi:hypothetical protein
VCQDLNPKLSNSQITFQDSNQMRHHNCRLIDGQCHLFAILQFILSKLRDEDTIQETW